LSDCHLCIHGHFYQPPRVDPFTGHIPREPDAAPYENWNERITAECYAPNAEAGHFAHLSFNLGGTLARWMEDHAPETYRRIVAGERAHRQATGVSNGLAQPVHHTILPLARRRDKICQVRWGIASFRHRFGHEPEGMWLPEMAVDHETLEVLATEGMRFVILSDEQVRGELSDGAGPYRVHLPDGQAIVVFVRDRHLSNALSFSMPDSAFVDRWLEEQVEWRCRKDGLLLVATDGETFGHHHRQGVKVLERIIAAGEAGAHGYRMTTLGCYLRDHPPQHELEVVENTAWSCAHGLARWSVGCDCTPGDSRWKGALRRALDNLACDLDYAYLCHLRAWDVDPWPLRDAYIAVVLGEQDGPDFLAQHGLGHLDEEAAQQVLRLLEAQFYRQRMYASCTFFFEDLDRHEPHYAIANAIRALALTRGATGEDLSHSFRRDLRLAFSGRSGRTGEQIFDALLERADR
jgi:alpha-amylase/alpha-mannosidase (GH57 family)